MASLKNFHLALKSVQRIYLDTSVFIYHLENTAPYAKLTEILFDLFETGKKGGCSSTLSILELNVGAYKQHKDILALTYTTLLQKIKSLNFCAMDLEIADLGARVRAFYGLKAPDAIHVATAINQKCDLMIGNDKAYKKITQVKYLHLSDMI